VVWVCCQRLPALLALAALAMLAACAQPARRTEAMVSPASAVAAKATSWSGRLALRVQDAPQQSFSAGFELTGAPAQGALKLLSPFGSTLALIEWDGTGATLRTDKEERRFSSLDQLAEAATGSPLPVRALFDWLTGSNTPLPGWQADLSGLSEGRLLAERISPAPNVHLRLVLEPPGNPDADPKRSP
jgi:outer membrane lipoprotein LolB